MSRSPCSIDRAGTTLLELLIYSILLMFLLGGLYLLLAGGLRYTRLDQAYQTAQQQALVGLRKIVDELGDASRSSTYFGSAPTGHIMFLSAAPVPPATGPWTYNAALSLEYKKWICYYRDQAERTLVRTELPLPLGPVVIPPPAPPPNFVALVLPLPSPPSRVVARGIESLDFSRPATGVIQIQIAARQATASDRFTQVSLSSRVRLGNE